MNSFKHFIRIITNYLSLKEYRTRSIQHWYQHNPERVMENEKATTLWDHQVKTDRHIPCNKPDIIIQEKDSERCLIIDVAIPSDYNIQKKATEKMSKYVDLQIECQRMWNKKVQVIPIIIGATGIVEKAFKATYKGYQASIISTICKVSHPRNSTYSKEGTVNQARLK